MLFSRSLVLWPDSDSALAGDHMWIRAWGGEWSPELHELPDGPAALHHGHLCTPATTLRHPCHHLHPVHFHGTHHVLPVCHESKEETTYKHISNTNLSWECVSIPALCRVLRFTYTKRTVSSSVHWKKLSPWSLRKKERVWQQRSTQVNVIRKQCLLLTVKRNTIIINLESQAFLEVNKCLKMCTITTST